MAKETKNNIRLGIFITLASATLIISLYIVGKNQSLFGDNFHARARFSNINGLMTGNNVRYSGIQAGTVEKITVINDTTIEVYLLINKKIKPFIKQNSLVSIGTEGMMGNKVINITPSRRPAPPVAEGGILPTKKMTPADEMLETLAGTNINASIISENLKHMLIRLNNSKAFWAILNDSMMASSLHASASNMNSATAKTNTLIESLNAITQDVRNGKGGAGAILSDPAVAENIKSAVANLNNTSRETDAAARKLDSITAQVQQDLASGNGPAHALLKDTSMTGKLSRSFSNIESGTAAAHALLKDTSMTGKLSRSLSNIESGTAAFDQNMEALKHNILTRGYFKRQERRKRKEANRR
jgi:phospholipid/cholesterol/gamma-HCH transport system substrate-binding protein